MRLFVQESLAGNDKTRCAKAALLGVVIYEGLLDGVQFVPVHQPLDCGDCLTLSFDCQDRARINGLAVDDYGASAARGTVTDALGPGKV